MMWKSADNAVADGSEEYFMIRLDSSHLVLIRFAFYLGSLFLLSKDMYLLDRLGLVSLRVKIVVVQG